MCLTPRRPRPPPPPAALQPGEVKYVAVARLSDGLVLASALSKACAGAAGAAVEGTARQVLGSGNLRPHQKLTVTAGGDGDLHLQSEEHAVVAAMCAAEFPRRQAFALLEELAGRSRGPASAEAVAAARGEGELGQALAPALREALARDHGASAPASAVATVTAKVEEVKVVMEGNINKVLENAENLASIENKSEVLRQEAHQFQKKSVSVRNALWWRNFKMKLVVAAVVLCVLGYILIPVIAKAARKRGT